MGRQTVRRLAGSSVGQRLIAAAQETKHEVDLDSWLDYCFAGPLGQIEAELTAGGAENPYSLFRGLDDELWAALLTREYSGYPEIRKLLPGHPDPSLQIMWNGATGMKLAAQSAAFYRKLHEVQGEFGPTSLAGSRVLDFGVGWGRLARFLARDLEPGNLYGCDPVEQILDVCREAGLPAELARSEFLPDSIPFEVDFDLVYSFSVFTHISEVASNKCLAAIHASQSPGGLFVVTVRPPSYLQLSGMIDSVGDQLGPNPEEALKGPQYLFVPHASDPEHPQFDGTEMHYGEAVITVPYIEENWSELYEIVDVGFSTSDMYQVPVTLRRRD